MRVLQCLTHSSLGGGQEVIYTLVRMLLEIRPGWTICVSLPPGGLYTERFAQLGVELRTGPWNRIGFAGVAEYRRHVRMFRPDLVHSHGKGAGLYARLLRDGCRHVHSYHGFHPPTKRSGRYVYRALEKALLRNTRAVVAVSDAEADELRETLGLASACVVPIPNVIDAAAVLKSAGLPLPIGMASFVRGLRSPLLVTMIARDDPAKNYPLAFSAAGIVLAREQRAAFAFVGPGGDNPALGRLCADFPGRVFVSLPTSPVAGLIAASAVVLLTSTKEGGRPLVLQEAFALGKPAVGTDVPGIRETIDPGFNGFLTAAQPEIIAEAILRLLSSPDLLKKYGENALLSSMKHNVREWAERYAVVYESCSAG